ncbi:MAG: hypothetical protein HKP25_11520 [Marinicaulis sp.]|nr:hypothetical protein [Marinicaulis sp.]
MQFSAAPKTIQHLSGVSSSFFQHIMELLRKENYSFVNFLFSMGVSDGVGEV